MNCKQLQAEIHTVSKNLFWQNCDVPDNVKRLIEKTNKFKFLDKPELTEKINQLKTFDINLLWDKKFWKLKKHESISAVASSPYMFLKNLINEH
jgi:hypothetical protein